MRVGRRRLTSSGARRAAVTTSGSRRGRASRTFRGTASARRASPVHRPSCVRWVLARRCRFRRQSGMATHPKSLAASKRREAAARRVRPRRGQGGLAQPASNASAATARASQGFWTTTARLRKSTPPRVRPPSGSMTICGRTTICRPRRIPFAVAGARRAWRPSTPRRAARGRARRLPARWRGTSDSPNSGGRSPSVRSSRSRTSSRRRFTVSRPKRGSVCRTRARATASNSCGPCWRSCMPSRACRRPFARAAMRITT